MTWRVMDGLIIATVLIGATHLWAQGLGGPKVVRPEQAGGTTRSLVRDRPAPPGGVQQTACRPAPRGGRAGGDAQPRPAGGRPCPR